MTRKHYEMLAAALKSARVPECYDHDTHSNAGADRAAVAVAEVLAADNPRFDRERFLRAAGVQS